MSLVIQRIGPLEAEKFLTAVRGPNGPYDFRNRRIEPRRVAQYARSMSSGQYDADIPLIALDTHGLLVGGFHTLLAVIESGTSWRFRVKKNLSEDLIPALNDSRSGTGSDELQRRGWRMGESQLGGAVGRLLLNFESPSLGDRRYSMQTTKMWSSFEIAERANKERDLIKESYAVGWQMYDRLHVNRTITGISYVKFTHEMGAVKTKDMFTKLIQGINLQEGEPVTWLRDKLERIQYETHRNRRIAHASSNRVWSAFLIASDAIAHNEPVKYTRIPTNPDGKTIREKFIWWE